MELNMEVRRLEEWNWKQRFKSLEDATEYLLNYAADLGPLAMSAMKRLKKKEEIINDLLRENKLLKLKIKKEVITNENKNREK